MASSDFAARFAVPAERLRSQFDESALPASSADIPPVTDVLGQNRARDAIAFGLQMTAPGYNIAVSGPPSSGRNTAVRLLVGAVAAARPAPPDWVYLHNFADPRRPKVVSLPAGLGDDLQRGLAVVVEACRAALPGAFGSDGYEARVQQAVAPVAALREQLLQTLQERARAQGFLINATQAGFIPVPTTADGTTLTPEAFAALPQAAREDWERRGTAVQESIAEATRELRKLDSQARQAVQALDREITRVVIGPLIDDLERDYAAYGLAPYLTAMEKDVVENLDVYKRFTDGLADRVPPQLLAQFNEEREGLLRRYAVNLLISHGEAPVPGAPVVVERYPRFSNLFGKVDFESRMGAMFTDFTRIHAGAVHMANGGYLVLQAQELLADPRSWLKLKQVLKTREIRIEDPGEGFTPFPVIDLVPEAIPLDLKVILVGAPAVLGLLDALDPDFPELFKVRAEFEPDTDCSTDASTSCAAFVRRTTDDCGLRPFARDALVEVLHYSNRLAGRQDRLTTRYGLVADLCQEADQLASAAGEPMVRAEQVRQALAAKQRRSSLVPDRLRRMIAEGTLHIETSGAVVGQVNGLAVYATGSHAFGTPMRITCRTGLGRRGVVAIERETERSGAIHTKGVLVLSGYLTGTFGRDRPLAFSASLTFEQSYEEVEGDSASSAELYAILTSLAGVPIRQDLAVTGSIDQFGNVQAIGGVTEKIEGFFDVCREVGLTGTQGVVIPATNVVNLTLRGDIVDAVREGRFHVWAVSRVEQGLEILTGLPAGERSSDGSYPDATVFQRVTAALDEMRHIAASADAAPPPGRAAPSASPPF